MTDKLIQYILIRKDLIGNKHWNIGSLIAQGCHASVAAIATTLSSKYTTEYITDHLNMTKLVLGVDDDVQLKEMSDRLTRNSIPHHLWIEKPEEIPTALATSPLLKSAVGLHFKHLKLLK